MNENLLAVHTANNICIESKKKNITSNETDAPSGRQSACVASSVANPESTNNEEKKWKIITRLYTIGCILNKHTNLLAYRLAC